MPVVAPANSISLSSTVSLRSPFALAPMAGLTDVPFRTLAWELGAGYMVSEMVTSKAELWETGKSRLRRVLVPGVNPNAVQIAGHDPRVMAESAKRLVGEGVEVIDINFGCPAKKVCRKAAGSALLGDIDNIGRIVETVAGAVDAPVTIKTRTGLTIEDEAGVLAACVAQEAGARMVVMHGRSRACRFKGQASYEKIQLAKQKLNIPLLVNGDIDSLASALKAREISGADGVMIGRGAIGQPWIFAELVGMPLPNRQQQLQIMLRHLKLMHEFYGPEQGMRIARKHIEAYLGRLGASHLCRAFMSLDSADAQVVWLSLQSNGALAFASNAPVVNEDHTQMTSAA
jgi:tRNA-dihydrouridine synthase B